MTTKNAIVDFLLKEERALIPGLLFHPFRNALMKGATMDEEAAAYLRKIRWVGVVIMAALSRHSGQSSARQIRLKARAHWKVATQNEKGNHLAYFNLVGQVSGKL